MMKIRNLLLGAVLICALGTMSACSIIGGLFGSSERDPNAPITASTVVSAFDLQVGDCFVSADIPASFDSITLIPCTSPHDAEVIYVFDMPDGSFDEDAIDAAAEQECSKAMDDYVGPNWDTVTSEGLWYSSLTPSEGTWGQGDREICCVATTISGDNELTSSVKGMGR
jgi:hypothetical protein